MEVCALYMKLKDGKSKVLTFSYDDCVIQDSRLIDIFNANKLKATFNINTGLYFPEDAQRQSLRGRMKLSEAKRLYSGSEHEVAVHGLTHLHLEKLQAPQVLMEILEDRQNIESQYHTLARGMAYPYGTYSEEVITALKKCGICYARGGVSTREFEFPIEWLTIQPTCHHNDPKLMELAKHFVEDVTRGPSENWLFYVWGHSYEFDNDDNWDVIEQFADYVSKREDVWYATNIEIYDYVKAYERLQVSVDETIIHNPSTIDVWISKNNQTYCVKAGERLVLM